MPKASIGLPGPGMTDLDVETFPLSSAHQRLDNFPDSNPLGKGICREWIPSKEPLTSLDVVAWKT